MIDNGLNQDTIKISHEEYERVYRIFREYLQHEDHLINHRTTWLITIQSFLWATFGFSYQKKYEVLERITNTTVGVKDFSQQTKEFDLSMIILIVVGFLTAFLAIFSIWAAANAILHLAKEWEGSKMNNPDVQYLPVITGGGYPTARKYGILVSKCLPLTFCILWVLTYVLLFTPFRQAIPYLIR